MANDVKGIDIVGVDGDGFFVFFQSFFSEPSLVKSHSFALIVKGRKNFLRRIQYLLGFMEMTNISEVGLQLEMRVDFLLIFHDHLFRNFRF
jgi:hypothetical protein